MEKIILIESKNNNKYLYIGGGFNKISPAHPLLFKLLEDRLSGTSFDRIKAIYCNGIILNEVFYSREDINYYLSKIDFIEKGINPDKSVIRNFNAQVKSKHVENSFFNCSNIVFEVTDSCNLNCKYCGLGKNYNWHDARKNKFFDFSLAKNFLDYYYNYNKNSYSETRKQILNIGFYGGEPLLNMPFIKSICDYTKKWENYYEVSFSMTTNGILIKENIDFLAQNNFRLLISIDGNEVANSYRIDKRNRETFHMVRNNINLIKNKYPEFYNDKVLINSVLHNRNSITKIIDYIKNEFNKLPSISEVSSYGQSEYTELEFNDLYVNKAESFKEFKKCNGVNIQDLNVIMQDPNFMDCNRHIQFISECTFEDIIDIIKERGEFLPSATCFPFSRKIFITVNGKILPCEHIDHKFSLGFVRNDKIDINFTKIADFYNKIFSRIKRQCTPCYGKQNCFVCAFYINNGDLDKKCPYSLNKDMYILYLKAHIEYLEENHESYNKLASNIFFQ